MSHVSSPFLATLTLQEADACDLTALADGRLLTAGNDKRVRLWDSSGLLSTISSHICVADVAVVLLANVAGCVGLRVL